MPGVHVDDKELVPFLKWPGGKRWITSRLPALLPQAFKRYIEPFLGGGTVFFFLRPSKALLSDANNELIDTYLAIRDHPAAIAARLRNHDRRHGKRYYYAVRASQPTSPAAKAARLIYLNRTCFNGIYRVNQEGEFNVPKGSKDAVLLPSDDFIAVGKALAQADVRVADFEDTIGRAQAGDLVFADPPYTVRHNNNAFVKYNETLFSWSDQERLAATLIAAKARGVSVVATNANHHSVRALYRDRGFTLRTVSRFSPISADPSHRKMFEELLILSQPTGSKNAPK